VIVPQQNVMTDMGVGAAPSAELRRVQVRGWRIWIVPLKQLLGGPVGAVLGGLCFGAWTAWANWDAGWGQALRSAAGQFCASALLTWSDARIMDWLFHRFHRRWAGATVAATGSLIGSYSLVIGVHWLIGTPHILLTLLPGMVPTVAYTVIYTTLLIHGRSHRHLGSE
jgi:hypothetical protein